MQKNNFNILFSNRFSVGLCLSPQRWLQRTKRKGRWRKWRSVFALQLGSAGRTPVCWIGKLVNDSLGISLHRETSPRLFSDVTDDFRIFCGDLGNEVNDDILARAFSRYPSFLKAKVPFPSWHSPKLLYSSANCCRTFCCQRQPVQGRKDLRMVFVPRWWETNGQERPKVTALSASRIPTTTWEPWERWTVSVCTRGSSLRRKPL